MNNLGGLSKKGGPTWSREFDLLIRAIGECKSKAEEDAIIAREVEVLKPRLKDAKMDKRSLKEVLVRLMYVEMLGHDASWGHVKALQACSDTNLLTKKVAYLASGLFLDYRSDLIILVVNTLTQDLKSDNYLVVCTALAAVCKLIGPDLVNAVLPAVQGLTSHPRDLVRKKAIMALHRFQQLDPTHEGHLAGVELDKFYRQALCDKDPSVMSAALCALHEVIRTQPQPYKNLIPSFISILKQVAEHRLPKAYDYHRTPAPSSRSLHARIKLLKILGCLGAGDKGASDNMYAVLADILRRANTGHTIGNAIVAEAVRTITSIYPNPGLLQNAAEMVAGFLKSSSHNLRYVGIDALAAVVRINAKYAAEQQLAVIDCLEDPDDTLKAKTLELLYKMTKPGNVEVIAEKLLEYLRSTSDDGQKAEVSKRIGELAERYAPETQWFIDTMNQVFELGGDVVAPSLSQGLMRLIAEGAGEGDDAADAELRAQAVASYLQLLNKPKLPAILLKVICWVLGEYGELAPGGANAAVEALTDAAEGNALSDEARGYLLSALGKLHARSGLAVGEAAAQLLADAGASHSVDLQLRALQFQALLEGPAATRAAALPYDASCEDVDVDPALPFLDAHVASALGNGAAPYIPERERFAMGAVRASAHEADAGSEHAQTHALRFAAYETPSLPGAGGAGAAAKSREPSPLKQPGLLDGGGLLDLDTGSSSSAAAAASSQSAPSSTEPQLALRSSGARKWGPTQFAAPYSAAAPIVAASSASAAAAPSMTGVSSSQRRAQEPDEVVPAGKARLAASLFGGGGDSAAPRSRRSPAKQAPTTMNAAASKAAAPNILDFGLDDEPSIHPSTAPTAAPQSQQDPFAALEGLSHPFDAPAPPSAAAAPAPGLDLDALYGAPAPARQQQPSQQQLFGGGLESLGLSGPQQSQTQAPLGDPFGQAPFGAPSAQAPFSAPTQMMGNLGLGGSAAPSQDAQAKAGGVKPMAARGNAAVETAKAKKDPFADLLG